MKNRNTKIKAIKIKDKSMLYRFDPKEIFQNQENVAQALSEALLEGDKEAFQEIFSAYLSIINKEELSRISKVPIATIRRIAAGSNCNIDTLLKITAAISKAA